MNDKALREFPILPLFLCDVTEDPKTELRKLDIKSFVLKFEHHAIKYINDLLDIFTPPDEFVIGIEKFLKKYPNLKNNFAHINGRLKRLSVAYLQELSRDALKKAICSKLNTTKCWQFYAAVNKLPIPLLLKNMISYQVPVNK